MIRNLQDELYQLAKQINKKILNNAPKLSSKYLKDRICKIKQYLNYIY